MYTPSYIDEMNLSGWGTAEVYYQIAAEVIDDTISVRSSGLTEVNQLSYKQLFHFRYSDGSRMLTFGGIITDSAVATDTDNLFDDLKYIRTGAEAFEIRIPNLTLMEIRQLDKLLPDKNIGSEQGETAEGNSDSSVLDFLPQKDVDSYKEIYRFFPAFTEANL